MDEFLTEDSTKKRLVEIETELITLQKQYAGLKQRWQLEKNVIQDIRSTKVTIEKLKFSAENLERDGELAKVAELRYGKIPELETKLKQANLRLVNMQADGKLLKEEVDAEDIAEVVSKWTGIPVNKMLETEKHKLLKMEDRIHERLISQDEAVSAVSNALRRSRAGLQDENRPIGSFIFIGGTGVGKTEMARALAEFLFDDEQAIVRIDMSEYMERFSVSRLIGAPPGYIGYDEGGQLTEAVRRRPYSVVLLDEMEKANPEVFNVLLQVLDEGRLTDGKGRLVDFKNTIIIMTSNMGTDMINDRHWEINEQNRESMMRDFKIKITEMLRKNLRPEFLNRIDEIVLFKPLIGKEIRQIADLQIRRLQIRLKRNGMKISITNEALDWITKLGYDAQFGARPLKRAIQRHIVDPLAIKVLSSEFLSGDEIKIDVSENGEFIFSK
jgi:ATP-dependent Clp protease ATP-binding subunit ClpB